MPAELTPQEFERLTKILEESKQTKATAEGAFQEQLRQVKKEFKCNTPEELKEKLEMLGRKKRRLGREAKEKYDQVIEQYEEKLDEN